MKIVLAELELRRTSNVDAQFHRVFDSVEKAKPFADAYFKKGEPLIELIQKAIIVGRLGKQGPIHLIKWTTNEYFLKIGDSAKILRELETYAETLALQEGDQQSAI
jgi:hypothetical protein